MPFRLDDAYCSWCGRAFSRITESAAEVTHAISIDYETRIVHVYMEKVSNGAQEAAMGGTKARVSAECVDCQRSVLTYLTYNPDPVPVPVPLRVAEEL